MASEWRETTWGEEVSLEYGKAIRGYRESCGKFRVFGSNGPIGWTDKALSDGPGVILGRKGAYRGVEFSRDPFWVIDTAYFVVPKSEFDMRWLYYAIKYYELGEIDDGSPIPSTTRAAVYVQELTVPPIEEQRVIAEAIGVLDDRIDNLRQSNTTLEAIAQALFKSWFVDFDPVRAKAEGREPEGMDAATAALFPSEFEDSELGQIPKSWRAGSLRDICKAHDSKRVPLSSVQREKRRGKYPYYGAASVMDYIDDFLFDGVYVLLAEDGSVATREGFALTQYVWGRMWVNNHAHVLEGANGYSTEQLLLLLQRVQIGEFITGAVQAKLSQSNMFRIPAIVPTEEVCEKFEMVVQPLFHVIQSNNERQKVLTDLRDTLLPRLISGKLRLPEAETLLEDALA